jgi:hypothetical protein
VAYEASPGRSDITGWPEGFADAQITTEAKMASIVFPDDALIAQKQREWTLRWQDDRGTRRLELRDQQQPWTVFRPRRLRLLMPRPAITALPSMPRGLPSSNAQHEATLLILDTQTRNQLIEIPVSLLNRFVETLCLAA